MPLQQQIEDITSAIDGRMGVCVRDLMSGEEWGVRMDEPLPMASVCKIPILVAAYRASDNGRMDLAERVEFTEATRCFGSGLLNAFDPGLQPTLRDLLLLMIVVSDNAATDLILQRLTPDVVTSTMRELGLKQIRLDRTIAQLISDILVKLDARCEGVGFGGWDAFIESHPDIKEREKDLAEARRAVNETTSDLDVATARDMARLCGQIAQNACASQESCESMLNILSKQQLNTRLPRDLPAFTKLAHKTGTLGSGAVVNDAGILFIDKDPVATIAMLSRDVTNPLHETATVIAGIGRAVFENYNLPR